MTGCICIDRKLETKITIDKTAINEIDSLYLLTGQSDYDSLNFNSTSVSSDENEYRFSDVGRIKVKLKNNTVIESKSDNWSRIKISKSNNKFIFEKIETSETFRMTKYYIVTFIIIFLIKVLTSLFIISPNKKVNFIIYFGLLNLLYFMLFEFFTGLIMNYLFSFYIAILILDLIFLIIKFSQKGHLRPILAGLISNVLFFTIGQFLITIYIMISN